MKKFFSIVVAVTGLLACSLTPCPASPSQPPDYPAIAAADYSVPVLAAVTFDADRWTIAAVSAIAIALAAGAYLPKCYRSFGALLRYLAKRLRDPIDRFCLLWRF